MSKTNTKAQKIGKATWIDVQDPSRESLQQITQSYGFHDLQIEQCLQHGHISQITAESDHIFLVLYFPYLINGGKVATSQVSIFLGKDYLITVHEAANPVVRQLFEHYATDTKAAGSEAKTPSRLLHHVIESLLANVASMTENIANELDVIEDNVFDNQGSDAFLIGRLRQKIMRLRRTLATQKSVLGELDGMIDGFSGEHVRRYYRINTNLSHKLWESVEEAAETIEIYKDADFTTSTEKTNKILAVLTLLFTLTIPATTIGTFYGMNILLPGGLDTGAWVFLGTYTTFKVIICASILAAFGMYLYFKSKRWL